MADVRTGGRGNSPDCTGQGNQRISYRGTLGLYAGRSMDTAHCIPASILHWLPAPPTVFRLLSLEHSRLGIPLFLAEDCPHGHMAIGTTVFPTSIGQASTWNPELIRQMGRVIAIEASAQGAHMGYGPVLDLARDPRWSRRVEETYGRRPLSESVVMGVAFGTRFLKGTH